MENLSNYEDTKKAAQASYNNIESVFSPAFKEKITFSAEGFSHIIFKNNHSIREESSQFLRFKLMPLAKKLIGLSTTYQKFEETIKEFDIKKYKKKIKKNRLVKYWGIIAIIDGQKIKVIVRKIGDNGSLHFWSVIPAWITNKYRDTKFFTTIHGDPEED